MVTLKTEMEDPELDNIQNQTAPSNDQDNGDSAEDSQVSSEDSRTVLESDSDINNKCKDLRS